MTEQDSTCNCQVCGIAYAPTLNKDGSRRKTKYSLCGSRRCNKAAVQGKVLGRHETSGIPLQKPYEVKGKGKTFLCQNPACGVAFVAGCSLAKYCGPKCRTEVGNLIAQIRRVDRSARNCKFCGISFAPQYGDKRSVFCSRVCRIREQYKIRTGSTHRRRSKRYGCEHQAINPIKVFERDKWRCHLCGVKTPKQLRGTRSDRAPELEHIVSLADGGSHTWGNVACSCRKCNLSKGSASFGQLGLGFAA